jgi:outer membrane protein OmpA-like peptidoglycan-associated protein
MIRNIVTCLVCICAASAVLSQVEAPSTQQMIQQLKPARTRGLRNLAVEETPGQTPTSTAPNHPALSLIIQFEFDSARVQPQSQEALANLAKALQSPELSAFKFAIEGHTDAKGNADYNLKLSQQRATAVREILRSQGVEPVRLVATGKGSTELANQDRPFAPENRRVRIVNLDL